MAKAVTRTGRKTFIGHIKSLFNGMGYVLTGQSMETGNIKAHYLAVLQGQEREKPRAELAGKLERGDTQTVATVGGIYVVGIVVVSMTAPLLALHTSVFMAGFLAYMGLRYYGKRKLEKRLSNLEKKADLQHRKILAHHKKKDRALLLTNNY